MSTNAPAATRALRALRVLAAAHGPMTAASLARALGCPRSSTFHLLAAMADQGFVVHYPEDERWGLGLAAFEIGTAYLRQEPLERLARPLLVRLAQRSGKSLPCVAYVGVLHGRETLYLALEESTRARVSVVADVGVRLPASLTASGRAMLSALPSSQVRALFPSKDSFIDRTGRGPLTPKALTTQLRKEAAQGWAEEDGFITPGMASIASAALDRHGRPVAAVGLVFRSDSSEWAPAAKKDLTHLVVSTARELSRRLH